MITAVFVISTANMRRRVADSSISCAALIYYIEKTDTDFRIIRIWKNAPVSQQKSFLNYKFNFFKTRDVMTLFATLDITSKDMEPMVVKTGFNF